MTEATILSGLLTHFATLTLPANVGVAWPNVAYEPDGNPHVRFEFRPNTPRAPHISGSLTIHRGIFLALVGWPAGQGLVQALELAGAIRDHFAIENGERRVIEHDGIEISIGLDNPPGVQGEDQGAVYTEVPVVIPFTVYP